MRYPRFKIEEITTRYGLRYRAYKQLEEDTPWLIIHNSDQDILEVTRKAMFAYRRLLLDSIIVGSRTIEEYD